MIGGRRACSRAPAHDRGFEYAGAPRDARYGLVELTADFLVLPEQALMAPRSRLASTPAAWKLPCAGTRNRWLGVRSWSRGCGARISGRAPSQSSAGAVNDGHRHSLTHHPAKNIAPRRSASRGCEHRIQTSPSRNPRGPRQTGGWRVAVRRLSWRSAIPGGDIAH